MLLMPGLSATRQPGHATEVAMERQEAENIMPYHSAQTIHLLGLPLSGRADAKSSQ